MLSNKRSHPENFVGQLCYKCKRTDFGGSARQLASHLQFCNGPSKPLYQHNSRSRKKKKVVHLDGNLTTSHPNGMTQFPFLMNNQHLVGYKNEVCFSNQDNHFKAGNPDQTQFNDNYQIDILLSDILNSAQDQNVLPNVHGNSQLDTPMLSPQCTRNSSMLHHP